MRGAYGKAMLVATIGVVLGMLAPASPSSEAAQRGFQRDPGEVIMNQSCLSCHDLTPIRTQAFDAEGWTDMVDTMIGNGAEVAVEQIPELVRYLAGRYGPLPDGDGKSILLVTCTVCHDRNRIWAHAGSDREHWETTLLAMLNEGAFLTNAEFNTLLNYLARNLGP